MGAVMKKTDHRIFTGIIVFLSIAGMVFRWTGIRFEGVDYQNSLLTWYLQLKDGSGLTALADYKGDYNLPYATILYFLTLIPIEPIISIKMVSVLFEYLEAVLLMKMVMEAAEDGKKYLYGAVAYGLVLCNPLAVINSGYLAQSEGIWAYLALLSFWYIWKDKPVRGMWMLGFALATKLQAVFILPLILILYFYKKKFSILHLLWIPVAIQALCIPAIIGGCSFDIAYKLYAHMLGKYPFMYYYYPNIWTFFQEAPYYQFGKAAICFTFGVLLIFAVLFVKSGKKHTLQDHLEYIAWTTMTCAMLLPCMHERYNYIAEMVLPLCAIKKPKYRLPAIVLVLISLQCNGQSYLAWSRCSDLALAAGNIMIYLLLTRDCFQGLYRYAEEREVEVC